MNYFRNVFEDFSSFEAKNHVRRHQQPSRRLPHVVVVGFVVVEVVVVDVVPGNGIEIEVRGKMVARVGVSHTNAAAANQDAQRAALIADQKAKSEEGARKTTTARLDEFLVQSGKERNVDLSGFLMLTSRWIQVQSCPCCNSSAPAVSGEASQRAMKTTKKSKAAEATKAPRATTIKNHPEAEGEAAASNQWPP